MSNKTVSVLLAAAAVMFCVGSQLHAQQQFWQQTNGPYGGNVQAIVVKSTGDWLAGTGDALYGPGSIFRSTDYGDTWIDVGSGLTNRLIKSLAIDSMGNLYAGTFGGGVFRSTDNGSSWNPRSNGINYPYVFSLAVTPSGVLFAGTNGGLFRSSDEGVSWSYLGFVQILTITVDRSGTVFTGSYGGGVRRSTDSGQSWVVMNNGLTDPYIRSLCVLENGWLYAGIGWGGVFRSTNGGNIWTEVSNGIGHPDVRAVIVVGADVFAAAASGVFRSTNQGDLWFSIGQEASSALASTQTWPLIVGTTPYGILRSSDAGSTWASSRHGMSNSYVNALVVISSRTIAAGTVGEVSLTTNGGLSWEPSDVGLPMGRVLSLAKSDSGILLAGTGTAIYRRLALEKSWTNVLNVGWSVRALTFSAATGDFFAGFIGDLTGGILRSSDGGTTWTLALDNPGGILSITSSANGYVYAGSYGRVVRTTDRGISWNSSSLTAGSVSCLAATNSGIIYAGTYRGVYRSNDEGETWKRWVSGLTDTNVTSITVNQLGHVFAGTRTGVFESTDAGASWVHLSSGLNDQIVQSLASDEGGFVFAGTQGSGVFRSRLSTTSISGSQPMIPIAFVLEQNYPNPFNPSTTFQFSIANSQLTTLKVYDLLGREVAALVNEVKEPGTYTVQWDASAVASGVYLYRLQSGGFSQTKRLVVLK